MLLLLLLLLLVAELVAGTDLVNACKSSRVKPLAAADRRRSANTGEASDDRWDAILMTLTLYLFLWLVSFGWFRLKQVSTTVLCIYGLLVCCRVMCYVLSL